MTQIKKILVTGARGFIGSAVMRQLQGRFTMYALEGDIRGTVPQADIIIHCAGRKNDEPDSRDVNVGGARTLRASGAKIINVSTASARLPRAGLYGRTKREADEVLKDHVTLRFSLVYGNGGILRTLIRWTALPVVPVYGSAVFHPIHIDDAVDVIEQALAWPSGVYDIGGPDGTTLRDLIHSVARIFHNKNVLTVAVPRLVARLYLTQSNILGAEQTLSFDIPYGRPLEQGLIDVCQRMSR